MQDDSASPSPFEGQRLWILVGGLVVLGLIIAGLGYWWLGHSPKRAAATHQPKLMGALGETVTALDTVLPAQDQICPASLRRALDFGALPPGSTLATGEAQDAQPEGHLTCEALGAGGKYTMNIDTLCADGKDKNCFALDSVRRQDGTWVYKRRPYLAPPQG